MNDERVLAQIDSDLMAKYVEPGLCPCCGQVPALWTPEEIVKALLAWVDTRDGQRPTQLEWERASTDHPTTRTVYRVFGKWSNMYRAAGLPPRRHTDPLYWTDERIIEAIQKWARDHDGDPPRRIDWQTGADVERPNFSAVVRAFGSWAKGIEAAGYFPRGAGGARFTTAALTKRADAHLRNSNVTRDDVERSDLAA